MSPLTAPVSPRTSETPMAFTREELNRGAITAGIAFSVSAPALLTLISIVEGIVTGNGSLLAILPGFLIIAIVTVLPLTWLTIFAGLPVARRIARALQHESRRWPHLLAFAALGAAAAILAALVLGVLLWGGGWNPAMPLSQWIAITLGGCVLFAPLAAGCAAYGWWRASREALRSDQPRDPKPEDDEEY